MDLLISQNSVEKKRDQNTQTTKCQRDVSAWRVIAQIIEAETTFHISGSGLVRMAPGIFDVVFVFHTQTGLVGNQLLIVEGVVKVCASIGFKAGVTVGDFPHPSL